MNDINKHASTSINQSASFCDMKVAYLNPWGHKMEHVRNKQEAKLSKNTIKIILNPPEELLSKVCTWLIWLWLYLLVPGVSQCVAVHVWIIVILSSAKSV